MSDRAVGGNDTLVSGTGNDDLWGDAQVLLGKAPGRKRHLRLQLQ
jgi:Ca2+-binding RTX toxin-like protein